jgi:tetratricopeptide (TPR) repeat protein
MPQEMIPPEATSEQNLLQQAIEAIRLEKFSQAREILTNLLRTDQENPEYWVWMSAAMETQKERLYCLQTANKMDPTNTAARRGLILLGALAPDDSIQPFPINHPIPWESKTKLTEDKDKPTGLRKLTGNPAFRLGAILGLGTIVLIGAFIGVGIFNARPAAATARVGGTPRPTVTPYATQVDTDKDQPTQIRPLGELLSAPYTPTPIYAATPHGDAAGDSYKGAMHAYKSGQWDQVGLMMAQVATAQPGSADTLYFIGEANRLSGKYQAALDFYNAAILVNANFAPSYLGRARVNMVLNPKRNVLVDLNTAISLDPNYAEAYMERGMYYYSTKKDLKSAQTDLQQSSSLSPSPLVEINLARVLLAQNENEAALEAAKRANQLDVTMLDGYLVLGMAYRATGSLDQAVSVLETYLKYQPDNAEAYAVLGAAYFNRADFPTAQKNLEQAVRLDKTNLDAFIWLGRTYMAQKQYDNAMSSFRDAQQLDPASFDATEGVALAYLANGEFNNSYSAILKVEQATKNDNNIRARFLFIRAQSLENLDQAQLDAAYKDWTELLSLPDTAATPEMVQMALERIAAMNTPTPTATLTKTPSPTIPAVTPTPSKTSKPTATRMPTGTPLVSPTP